jgi:hypothetical protein
MLLVMIVCSIGSLTNYDKVTTNGFRMGIIIKH